ncbi:leucine-rich repeat and coiled-coil domain-containing protein 1 [Eupeodes corollae]|uniref:leucine-rich repeat and coiled-coil domain-containing protein 1 n=1 Tax=Eupeodes corollae TaxID=290404 RepID=UPI002492834F|nr:leucine-rich repeat and coiled-coil domain-containing protein 1 [Eupeodes corollae]
MTELLSREQEFLKINENLDKMTKLATEKPQPTKIIDSKYATYTKKCPIIAVRQHSKTNEMNLNGIKEKNSNTKENVSQNGVRKKIAPKERQLQGIVEEKKNNFEENVVASVRSSVRTLPLTRSTTSKYPSNVVLRYKNNSFIQSPSLEILVRDENESIRSLASSRTSEFSGAVLTARPKIDLSSEGLLKYLKSRIVILQSEHEKITQELSVQKELAEKSAERQKKVETQRDLAYSRNNALSEQLAKLEGQLEEALRRFKDTDSEHNTTRKELETTKRELKVLTQTHANVEKRLYRTSEELDNTRNILNQMKSSDKEVRESIRNETEAKDKQIKSLKKQRADLLNAYKKQLFLIDNLKRQNLCMEQSKMVAFGEKEFNKVLDWQTKT